MIKKELDEYDGVKRTYDSLIELSRRLKFWDSTWKVTLFFTNVICAYLLFATSKQVINFHNWDKCYSVFVLLLNYIIAMFDYSGRYQKVKNSYVLLKSKMDEYMYEEKNIVELLKYKNIIIDNSEQYNVVDKIASDIEERSCKFVNIKETKENNKCQSFFWLVFYTSLRIWDVSLIILVPTIIFSGYLLFSLLGWR